MYSRAIRFSLFAASIALIASCGSDDPDTTPTDTGNDTGDAGGDVTDADDDTTPPAPFCGDGTLATSEECEGFDLRGETCVDRGFSGGRLACAADCTFDETLCVSCGDGVVGGSEVCDTTVDPALTCELVLGPGATGTLSCAEDCMSIVDDACVDAPVDTPFAPCDDVANPCTGELSCTVTELGAICIEPCTVAADCDDNTWCAPVGEGVSTCLPRATDGQRCDTATPCAAGLDCIAAFGTSEEPVSLCARACGSCDDDELCLDAPAELFEVASDTICDPGTITACIAPFECVDVDSGRAERFRCARPQQLCATPQQLYGFGDAGPTDEQICDLSGPSAGGRFCGLPALRDGATAVCYPIFGEGERLGVCMGLCDDGTIAGIGDFDCGEDYTCRTPATAGLYYPQPGDQPNCETELTVGCPSDYPDCIDLGDGPICSRPARICALVEE
jgi:hypothetical protein